jgi:hypothetical protein
MPHFSLSGKSILISSFLLFSLNPFSFAQRPFRHFNTQQLRQAVIKENPGYKENLVVMENSISNLASRGDNGGVLYVPVIFHIVGAKGQTVPDQEQVNFQLDVLNKAFGNYAPEAKEFPNADVEKFISMGAKVGIEFYLPSKVGEIAGVGKPAFNAVTVDRKSWGLFNEIQDPTKGGLAAVAPDKIINVWVGQLDGDNAGYAYLPGPPGTIDGIVIDQDFFGNEKGTAKIPYVQGKTLVHLMGTYLGLYELWNEQEPCKDDLVEDTPLHDGPSISVTTDKNSRFVCFCPGTPTAMFMNFMDNTDDAQLSMFTEGQKKRMRAVLLSDGLRNGLPRK